MMKLHVLRLLCLFTFKDLKKIAAFQKAMSSFQRKC